MGPVAISDYAPAAIVLLSATAAGYFDLRWRRVPNWLVALTIALSLVWHGSASGVVGLGVSSAGLLVGTAVLFPLFLLRAMGAGDVKFFGALGAAFTHRHVLSVLVISLGVAALMAFYRVVRGGCLKSTLANMADLLRRFGRGHIRPHPVVVIDNEQAVLVPFTLAVAIASWIFVLFR